MSIKTAKPAITETVGAQYLCFASGEDSTGFSGQYEEDVEKTETVKKVKVSTNGSSEDVYASGKVYDTDNTSASKDIEVEAIAFPADTIAKALGSNVDTGGLISDGADRGKPYFAYGKVVKKKHGQFVWEWYPKCMMLEISDETSTKEEKFSEQTQTVTIRAYAFNEDGDFRNYVDSESKNFPKGLTEEKFFVKPILTPEDLETAIGGE